MSTTAMRSLDGVRDLDGACRMRWLAALVVMLGACSDDGGPSLFVDLRTDFAPDVEFQRVRTTLSARPGAPALLIDHEVESGASYLEGRRVADFLDIAPGAVSLVVELVKDNGSVVAERRAAVELRDDLAVTVVITRSCLGIECPGSGDDPGAVACLGGRCVAPECSAEHPEACGPAECDDPTDCGPYPGCVQARCELGSCLAVAMDSLCGAGQVCDRELGCLGGAPDGGVADGGDAGLDAGGGDAGGPGPLACADSYLGSRVGPDVATGTTRDRDDDYARCLGGGSPDVSFGWVAPASGSYVISTCGSSFDTVLTALEGSCAGSQRACADDGCGLSSRLVLMVDAGDAFVFIVDGLGESGPFRLSIEPI
jgi:hypothetical protein